jgi:hypothetical protein
MNNDRRKEISIAAALIERAKDILEDAANAEQEAFDNMPESLQQGEKGEAMEETIGVLQEAQTGLETALDELNGLDGVIIDVRTDDVRATIV